MTAVWIGLGGFFLLLAIVALSYNRFVSQRQYIHNTWANVDTELRRRYDLIPNLVETVKGYAAHERTTLEAVIQARSAAVDADGDVADQASQENLLVGALRQMMALSEAYPELRADAHFGELQRELTRTENRIQAARRLYNNNVRDFNRRVESIPTLIVARLFGFPKESYFEIDTAVRDAPPPSAALS